MKFSFSTVISFLFILYSSPTFAQEALSSRIASYDISLTLDENAKMLNAEEVLYWTNPSTLDTVRELRFHVYMNAFKNNQSTYLSGGGGFGTIGKEYDEECLWGYTDILKITDLEGRDLTTSSEYIAPDDGNKADQTVLRVPLISPVPPGQSIDVKLDWIMKIPKTISRTGYAKDFHFLVQWFPKVGVYEPAGMRFSEEGNWNCHQYHAPTEYYSDFGLYKVDINVPANYVVGASGVLLKQEKKGDRTIHYFQAPDVIDFAWTASPNFVSMEEQWQDVNLRLLSYPSTANFAPRIFDAAKNTLEYLQDFVGLYPYEQLTIVVPPYHGLKSGAMEYPNLVTTFALNGLPEGLRSTETLTIHEIVHQYFMQMIATNEQEEAWLDEGFTSYFEGKIMDKYYGGFFYDAYFDINVRSEELRRGRFFGADNIKLQPLSKPTYLTQGGSHRELSYGKAAVLLRTLEGLLGEPMMRRIMQKYFNTWKFKHPCGDDFIDLLTEIVKDNYEKEFAEQVLHFVQQAVYGTEVCDYALVDIKNIRNSPERGIFLGGECKEEIIPSKEITSRITLHRLGEMQVPVEILLTFEDGSTLLKNWDGQDRVKVFKIPTETPIMSAEIDPERKIYIDQDFINNSRRIVKDDCAGIGKTSRTFFTWLQNIFTGISLFV